MTQRTDAHRPGMIVPAEYSHVCFYSLSTSDGGVRIPSIGVNCELDFRSIAKAADGALTVVLGKHAQDGMCCVLGLRTIAKVPFATKGGTGKCTVCGAHYVHGEIWRHDPTGEHIHIGHICSRKYELLADYSAHELAIGRRKHAMAKVIEARMNADERATILASYPGLADAFEHCTHRIVVEIKARFASSQPRISDKQSALVMKLYAEQTSPRAAEVHVPAPIGRTKFVGTVVSVKTMDGAYGITRKMTVKVATPGGAWLAWLTVPSDIDYQHCRRGSVLEITATLSAGNDAHFAFGKRPKATALYAAL